MTLTRALTPLSLVIAVTALPLPAQQRARDTSFAGLIAQLSEPGGYFDTDNLVSNEGSYLHVMGALRQLEAGGAYLGVGPDQNFSYIVAVRPAIALLVDIRRDNLLLHLFFRTLFLRARNRLEYLALLFAKPLPADLAAWDDRDLTDLLDYIDQTPGAGREQQVAHDRVRRDVLELGVPLDSSDLAKIAAIHREFITTGLSIRLTTFNRPPRLDYPTYRQLLLERDREGRLAGYLARETDFRHLRQMQRDGKVVPVVGDLSGSEAMGAIARLLAERRLRVSAFYTSNVEQYLMRDGTFGRFAANVAALPSDARSVIIRSYFLRGRPHPAAVEGYNTVQLLQTFASFNEAMRGDGYESYFDLVTRTVP